jgi:hypothetical protein
MEYLDKPALDDTPRAHPAYFRGKAKGINDVLKIVSDIMLGLDNGTGANNHPGIEQMRQALLVWREEINSSFGKKSGKDKQPS